MSQGSCTGQHILILGLGTSGLAMARWCAREGAEVTVADTRAVPPQWAALQAEWPDVRFIAGPLDASLPVASMQAVYKSPGLSPSDVAPVLEAAKAAGISVEGELSLFAKALNTLADERGYAPKVLAVTGTNGKTTVTSLTGQLVARAGKTVAVAGNIGPTLMDTLSSHLSANTLPEVWVLELSSFQLQDAGDFEPTAGTVLNITQDHLDWHGDMAAYTAAKAHVFGRTGAQLLNREDAGVMALQTHTVKRDVKRDPPRTQVHFGSDMPKRPGDFGIEVTNGMAWLVRAHEADETRRKRNEAAQELHVQRLMPADALRIRGRHNATNALAALALAHLAGCALGPALYALRDYRGEPHRVESVAVINGVDYVDDSKGTNVGATVAALKGLGETLAGQRRIWVILGGEGKGQDFTPLAAPVAQFARGVVLIGRDAGLIRAALVQQGLSEADLREASTLPEAVAMCRELAQAGELVLLSPACASFDMFTSYTHRAQVFCDAVQGLAWDVGVQMEAAQ